MNPSPEPVFVKKTEAAKALGVSARPPTTGSLAA
jgi:hypothetical protein